MIVGVADNEELVRCEAVRATDVLVVQPLVRCAIKGSDAKDLRDVCSATCPG